MTNPISLDERSLERGQMLYRVGRVAEARRMLIRLIHRNEVPATLRADAHRLLGEIALDDERFAASRFHFRRSIELAPDKPETCIAFASAVLNDPGAELKRAKNAVRRAIRLNDREPRYWCLLGQVARRMGQPSQACAAFRRASLLSPKPGTLAEIIDGLVSIGRGREAELILHRLRSRHPEDLAIQGIWERFRFSEVRLQQRRMRNLFEAPSILQFKVEARDILRVDRRSTPRPHLHLLSNETDTAR